MFQERDPRNFENCAQRLTWVRRVFVEWCAYKNTQRYIAWHIQTKQNEQAAEFQIQHFYFKTGYIYFQTSVMYDKPLKNPGLLAKIR